MAAAAISSTPDTAFAYDSAEVAFPHEEADDLSQYLSLDEEDDEGGEKKVDLDDEEDISSVSSTGASGSSDSSLTLDEDKGERRTSPETEEPSSPLDCGSHADDSSTLMSSRTRGPPSAGPLPRRGSRGLLTSLRRSGRRILSPVMSSSRRGGLLLSGAATAATSADSNRDAFRDVLSITIHCQMWHITDMILLNLDAVSLRTCEEVCVLWRRYIRSEKVWKKIVEKAARKSPILVKQNGWSQHLTTMGGQDPDNVDVYRQMYWKMTNLGQLWSRSLPLEKKNHVKRSGSIVWSFLHSGRSISAYNSGRGYVLKIHDNMTSRVRHSQAVTLGTVKKDSLCIDATDKQVAVGGLVSQKVWVFNIKQAPAIRKGPFNAFLETLVFGRALGDGTSDSNGQRVYTEIFKFINAGAGVARVKLHSDGERIAVLMPLNQTVEVWLTAEPIRLQSHTVQSDSCFLIWQDNLLLTAPLYSGIIQTVDTKTEREAGTLSGPIRRIDSVAMYGRLCATGEGKLIKLWGLDTCSILMAFVATKTFVSALFLNDAMVASGSSSGIVKLWDLSELLSIKYFGHPLPSHALRPLRRINMKGVLHYPIKMIDQFTYVDMVIVAKYEARKKMDKIKVVQVISN